MKTIHLTIIAALLLAFTACNTTKKRTPMNGNYVHAVYFWLKDPSNADDRKAFEQALDKFINSSDNIASVHVGTPPPATREVVDASFTYSLVVVFNSKKEHDIYQKEQAHLDFIEEAKHLWSDVKIFDSEKVEQIKQ